MILITRSILFLIIFHIFSKFSPFLVAQFAIKEMSLSPYHDSPLIRPTNKAREKLRKNRRNQVMLDAGLTSHISQEVVSSEGEELDLNYSFKNEQLQNETGQEKVYFWTGISCISQVDRYYRERILYKKDRDITLDKRSGNKMVCKGQKRAPRTTMKERKIAKLIASSEVNYTMLTADEIVLSRIHKICNNIISDKYAKQKDKIFTEAIFNGIYSILEPRIETKRYAEILNEGKRCIENSQEKTYKMDSQNSREKNSREEQTKEPLLGSGGLWDEGKRPKYCLDVFPPNRGVGGLAVDNLSIYRSFHANVRFWGSENFFSKKKYFSLIFLK